jgi:hypothetical protein
LCPSFPIPISCIGSPILRMPRRCRDTDIRSISAAAMTTWREAVAAA